MSWSISVKTVGNTVSVNSPSSSKQPPSSEQKDFTIQVEPNEFMSSIHRKIEEITGLKSSQQRLIYRGRLISSGGSDVNTSADNANSSVGSGGEVATASTSAGERSGADNSSSGTGDGLLRDSDTAEGEGGNTLSATGNTEHQANPNTGNGTGNAPVMESRICDVAGLSDGQTIHLVPRPISHSNNNTSTATEEETSNETSSSSSGGNVGLLAALLGLGSSTSTTTTTNNNGTTTTTTNTTSNNKENDDSIDDLEAALSMPRIRTLSRSTSNHISGGSGGSSSSRRRNNYRRTENDPLHPEPCPLEPVRQGLMTLHTMIGENRPSSDRETNENNWKWNNDNFNENNNDDEDENDKIHCKPKHKREECTKPHLCNISSTQESPLNTHRKWYIGQWLDCRDTVNQWLEATVVEIMTPDEILISVPTKSESNHSASKKKQTIITTPYTDPAIGASDTIGRKKLLLEPTEDESDSTLADLNNDSDLIGYKERDHNDQLQLLKIHYNGWPHRWDEWIRSDSERIRPFRTRSRHVQSRSHLNPSPQTVFHAAPPTHVVSEDDEVDRLDVLPELYQMMDVVQSIFGDATGERHGRGGRGRIGWNGDDDEDGSIHTVIPLSEEEQMELSMALKELEPEKLERVLHIVQGPFGCGKSMDVADIIVEELEMEIQHKLFCYLLPSKTCKGESDTNKMLPWKEVAGDPEEEEHTVRMQSRSKKINKKKLQNLAPLLDRLGRVLVDFAPHVASIADSLPDRQVDDLGDINADVENLDTLDQEASDEVDRDPIMNSISSTRSLRPLWSMGRDRDLSDTTPLLSPNMATSPGRGDDDNTRIDPDYADFVNGFIGNNTRTFGSPPRSTARRSNSDSFGSSLLSAFLASAAGGTSGNDDTNDDGNGPRIVRLGNGGGSGGAGGGGGNGSGTGGIDIHIHAIVTGPGGAMTGVGGLDGLTGLMPPPSPTATLTPTANIGSSVDPSVAMSNAASNGDDDDDLGLFSDLYAEGEELNNTSEGLSSIPATISEVEIEDDENEGTNAQQIPHLLNDDTNNIRIDSPNSSIPQPDGRERNTGRSSRSNSNSNGPRRTPMLGRIFRRALSRRSANGNNHGS